MSAGRARKVFLFAIAISLLVHLIFAGYFRWNLFDRMTQQPETFKVRTLRIARIVHTPPPTPPPTPAPTPVVRSSVQPPHIEHRTNSGPPAVHFATPGPAVASAPPPAASTAAPLATSTPGCAGATLLPTVSATPPITDIPPDVRAAKVSGTAAVQVALDPQGRVTGATVTQSTGNSGLDNVAVDMARSATYSPKLESCKAVAGTYTFTVDFAAW